MGSLQQGLANLRGRAKLQYQNHARKVCHRNVSYPCRNYPLTSPRPLPGIPVQSCRAWIFGMIKPPHLGGRYSASIAWLQGWAGPSYLAHTAKDCFMNPGQRVHCSGDGRGHCRRNKPTHGLLKQSSQFFSTSMPPQEERGGSVNFPPPSVQSSGGGGRVS